METRTVRRHFYFDRSHNELLLNIQILENWRMILNFIPLLISNASKTVDSHCMGGGINKTLFNNNPHKLKLHSTLFKSHSLHFYYICTMINNIHIEQPQVIPNG